ncbi:Ragulator complex protein lamtor2 [Geranomyces variabilis]|uniref:Ragulator complex protein lamtor2 n=1 Tax=Geranomyces variabilis TaxID=109894 RepID=A0AAD5XSF4_9FUNG|nr:Ragulator complex protein lamtor2 [Geranomyces variabilis]
MLKPKAIAQVLAQVNTAGVKATLLLNPDGSLISFAGWSEREARVLAAVASNVWFAYERHGRPAGSEVINEDGKESLQDLILECEAGKLCVSRASKMLLCLVADEETEWGLLKAKVIGNNGYAFVRHPT